MGVVSECEYTCFSKSSVVAAYYTGSKAGFDH